MTNQTLKTIAFAAAALIATGANAQETAFNSSAMMQTINASLDQQHAQFSLALVEQTEAKFQARHAQAQSIFGPLAQPVSFNLAEVRETTKKKFDLAVLTKAEFDVSKKVANIENPFEARLPIAPIMIAFHNEDY